MSTPAYPPADEIAPPRREPRALPRLAEGLVGDGTVLVAVDDDPTGAQTVHDVPLVTAWSDRELRWGLRHARTRGLLFVLTNSRSLDPDAAHRVATEVATTLARAATSVGVTVRLLSRGDSTLRGHYPVETDALAAAWQRATGEATDAVVLCPAYHEAGRVTVGGQHLVRVEGVWTPAERTEFSRDATFGFTAGDLPGWVAERSGGRISPAEVTVVDLATIRQGGVAGVVALLDRRLSDRNPSSPPAVVALDAAAAEDMEVTALALAELERAGHRFLYRTGPAYVRVRAGLPSAAPLQPAPVPRESGVLVVVGSHTALTTAQTAALRAARPLVDVTLPVDTLLTAPDDVVDEAARQVVGALRRGDDVLLETSRALRRGVDAADSLRIARVVSRALVSVVRAVRRECPPSCVVAKGGITSHEVAVHGLGVRRARVLGSLLPGAVSLWQPLDLDGRPAGPRYTVFPGNVGDEGSLVEVVHRVAPPPARG
ncbi:hypothetical protein C1701_24820 [Actinoalloteichus sp. AHMU CJ021]|uniref:four-carbon acid sugar kinase family protein n=1 Tax=Actinoalloteichus sp. AHMU CJ021 TaxID=2072503 RepID=UPI000CA064A3|nr:hypothetical protein C1701_24820 [Actinoalloteichus sp. AHMU CJ021]